jgi:hypothetical protein
MSGASVAALQFGLSRFDASGGGCVCPVGDLDNMTGHTVKVANIVFPAGA